ncbi:beta-1,6-galactofuranosyltransferase [Enterobacter hormaechei]|uniref:hypothetical protein n=1 Tax=Enterobacter hormaechei TaxID=158836 RepID=UPI001256EB21|nr:hypothetical protein [Enterobacter hormaechei]MCE1217145.1 hypothetical protein [Enterobacter hormaechei]VAE86093.1 beta-1,6-galactofuranosyltransferase [Enterobacter hormaechei]
MTKFTFIHDLTETANHAGFKARFDAKAIAENIGGKIVKVPLSIGSLFSRLRSAVALILFLLKVHNKENLVFNYPLAKPYNIILNYMLSIRKLKVLFIIHDLNSLRRNVDEDDVLFKASKVISHNASMNNHLVNIGFSRNKIITLDIFDYLLVGSKPLTNNDDKSIGLLIAGNLSQQKAGYLYRWDMNFSVDLFGIHYNGTNENLIYHGVFEANNPEVILDLNKRFYGLVWDGDSPMTCEGIYGEYLKYNNPHKASLYLSLGLPIIVWKESALSEFVVREKCGVIIEKLSDLEAFFKNTNDHEQYFKAAKRVGQKISRGYYLEKALIDVIS